VESPDEIKASHHVLDLVETHLAAMLDSPLVLETSIPLKATNPEVKVAAMCHDWRVLGDGQYRVMGREFFAEVEWRREGENGAFHVLNCNNAAISQDDIVAWCAANIQ
jgi:hypothetical protein